MPISGVDDLKNGRWLINFPIHLVKTTLKWVQILLKFEFGVLGKKRQVFLGKAKLGVRSVGWRVVIVFCIGGGLFRKRNRIDSNNPSLIAKVSGIKFMIL